MKRRILLLTAVVMIAVMLSGCIGIPYINRVKVSYDLDPDIFETKKSHWVEREEILEEIVFKFKEGLEVIPEFVVTVEPELAVFNGEYVPAMDEEDEEVQIGIKILGLRVEKRSITIAVAVVKDDEPLVEE